MTIAGRGCYRGSEDRDTEEIMAEDRKPKGETWKDVRKDEPAMTKRDEAKPGTPGTGEDIDPKTGERFNEGIGGA
ncbi:hypothetical protein ACUQ99_21470 [Azospirillum sp. A39]